MTFGMFYKTTPVFLSKKTSDNSHDEGAGDVTSSTDSVKGKRNSAPLPKIRVEECGLTVDMRRKGRNGEKVEVDSKTPKIAHSKVGARGDRERWVRGTRDASNGQSSSVETSISTEFVDSLRIGKAEARALSRGHALPGPLEPRPVPRIRYSKGAPNSRSIGDVVDTFQMKRAASMGDISSRERVVIRRLAAKRSETVGQEFLERNHRASSDRAQRAAWRDRRYHSLGDTWSSRLGQVSRKYKRGGSIPSDQFDLSLTFMNPDTMVRELRSGSGGGEMPGGNVLDKTRRSRSGESGGSSDASDGSSVVHSVDCPMCHLYEPSRFGHVCPPNTPLAQPSSHDDVL